jgi:hypothetical protein
MPAVLSEFGFILLFSFLDLLSVLPFCDVLLPLQRGLPRASVQGKTDDADLHSAVQLRQLAIHKHHVYSAGLFFCAPSFSLISRILAASIRYLCEASVALRCSGPLPITTVSAPTTPGAEIPRDPAE